MCQYILKYFEKNQKLDLTIFRVILPNTFGIKEKN